MRDYYKILGVQPLAEQEVIEGAYRALMKKYHPDKCSDATAERRAQEINEAYQVLRDPLQRQRHDGALHHSDAGHSTPGVGPYSARFSREAGFAPAPNFVDPPDEAPSRHGGWLFVRRSILVLVLIYAAMIIGIGAMFMSGTWHRVPPF